jgi:hypothetical protein
MAGINSDIDLKLPSFPSASNPELQQQLIQIYDAFRVLQLELSKAKSRITALEAYNVAHP